MHEEYLRSISLWLRDYLAKQGWPAQGYVISLSGGKDSAYGALAVAMMIEMEVRENGVEGFLAHFPKLKDAAAIRAVAAQAGEHAALEAIKARLLTCVYLPTENSSPRTLNAARFLIEGGVLPNGEKVAGIGGTFYVAPVQAMLDEAVIAYTGLDLDKVAAAHSNDLLGASDSPAVWRSAAARACSTATFRSGTCTARRCRCSRRCSPSSRATSSTP